LEISQIAARSRAALSQKLGWLAGFGLAGWLQTGIVLINAAENTDVLVSFL
jgi:hypothetical protein